MGKSSLKYVRIMEYYITKIKSREMLEGEKMPTEDDICKLFNVSRITVRQALEEMSRRGFIVKMQGKGSFVSVQKTQMQLNNLQGFSEEMKSKGLQPSTKVVDVTIITPGKEIAEKLKIGDQVKVYSVIRIRCADNIAMAVEHAYIPFYLCTNLEQQDLTQSMYKMFGDVYRLKIVKASQNIEAISADKRNAQLLGIHEGMPALKIERISTMEDGTPCEYVSSVYRGDKYKFYVELDKK